MSRQKAPTKATLTFWIAQIEHRTVPISRCVPHPRNPRQHPPEQIHDLRASFRRFGQYRSLVGIENVKTEGHVWIAAGCGTLQAMNEEHAEIVDVGFLPPETPPEIVEGIMVADNNLSAKAVDDDTALAQLIQEQQDAGFDLASLGSDDETLRQMLESLGDGYLGGGEQEDGAGGDEFDTTPEEGPTRTHVGELWKLGEHRLLVGDSTQAENLAKLMQGERVDMVLTDPPYGMAYEPNHDDRRVKHNYNGAGYHNVKRQSMITGDDTPFDPAPILAYFHDVKEQFWWGADYYADLLPDRIKGSWLVWDKRAGIEDMQFNTSSFELCWSRTKHLREIIRVKWFGIQGTEQQDIKQRLHPTQKPLQAISFILEKYSEANGVIVDPYIGSGTTLISCQRLGRRCYGCEIEPRVADVILKRYEAETNQQAQLLERVEVPAHA